ncbi:MAG: acyl carrier protein [Colwellia sp.]|nr:acyl carrier protein [Colwellia sp.]NQZ80655.1 acyl carrier protein [Colwellia sp.]
MINTQVKKYQEFLAKILNCKPEEIDESINFKNYASWDSFAHVEVMVELEAQFSIEFNEENFVKYGCAKEINKLFETEGKT